MKCVQSSSCGLLPLVGLLCLVFGCSPSLDTPLSEGDAGSILAAEAEEHVHEQDEVEEKLDSTDVATPAENEVAPIGDAILKSTIRIATFNTALNRPHANDLATELETGTCDQALKVAEIIQRVRPDILLLNEVDYDTEHRSATLLQEKYLAVPQNGQEAIQYPHRFLAEVNTGVPSGIDMNRDGKDDAAEDAYGYGKFPGQYGMIVFSRFPINESSIRTFQKFLWKDMPDAMLPKENDKPYYNDSQMNVFRLSSKSHWDVPIKTPNHTIHFLVSHPTPPVFDGKEDRNGTRNHDEIRLFADYITPGNADYLYDDAGSKGGLPADSQFVIAGDLNADPSDGASTGSPMKLLLENEFVDATVTPASRGAVEAAKGEVNQRQQGDPANDTGAFGKRVGNLRIDYVLPSRNLRVVGSGVFWPSTKEEGHAIAEASDHRLVWIDVDSE